MQYHKYVYREYGEMNGPHNLLPHERVLRDVVGECLPEPDGVRVHVQMGLYERDGGVFQVEFLLGGKRVIDSAHTKCLLPRNVSKVVSVLTQGTSPHLERRLRVEALDDESRDNLTDLHGRVPQAGWEGGGRRRGRAYDCEEDRLEELARELHS